jgi:RNA polymerase sigma-70 factor (ECF subfamily)
LELLEAWRGGDTRAGDELAKRYYASIMRFFEVRTPAAEDLTQKTFLAAVEGKERFRADATFRSYLYAIARRLLMRHLSDAHRFDKLSRFGDGDARPTSVSALMVRRQEHHLLLAALATLDENIQTMLILFYWDGMMAKEIGDVLDVPTSTITTRLSRARQALRDRIEKMATGEMRAAILDDLDQWTRSIVEADGAEAVPDSIPEQVVQAINKSRGE